MPFILSESYYLIVVKDRFHLPPAAAEPLDSLLAASGYNGRRFTTAAAATRALGRLEDAGKLTAGLFSVTEAAHYSL